MALENHDSWFLLVRDFKTKAYVVFDAEDDFIEYYNKYDDSNRELHEVIVGKQKPKFDLDIDWEALHKEFPDISNNKDVDMSWCKDTCSFWKLGKIC